MRKKRHTPGLGSYGERKLEGLGKRKQEPRQEAEPKQVFLDPADSDVWRLQNVVRGFVCGKKTGGKRRGSVCGDVLECPNIVVDVQGEEKAGELEKLGGEVTPVRKEWRKPPRTSDPLLKNYAWQPLCRRGPGKYAVCRGDFRAAGWGKSASKWTIWGYAWGEDLREVTGTEETGVQWTIRHLQRKSDVTKH